MNDFTNKVIVITGGCSGIGKAAAKKFNQAKAKIVLFGRDAKKFELMKKELDNTIFVQGDVGKIADLERLYQKTSEHFGNIDVLVINAGVTERREVAAVDEAMFDTIVDTNFKGAYFTLQRSVSHLNDGAAVILISSIAGHFGWPSHSVYSAAKAAVSALARNFSADLIHRGIRVNAISPGYTVTPIHEKREAAKPGHMQAITKKIPLGRFANADDIANAAIFLASPQAAYIVGIDLVVDGGVTQFAVNN